MYGFIIEHKLEGPLIWETKPLTYDQALDKIKELSKREQVIRAAVFKIQIVEGNESLGVEK